MMTIQTRQLTETFLDTGSVALKLKRILDRHASRRIGPADSVSAPR
jgi:hypothetical protein